MVVTGICRFRVRTQPVCHTGLDLSDQSQTLAAVPTLLIISALCTL